MISTDIARSAPAANVNAECATLRELAEWNAFHACRCFAGLWLRFESARAPMLAAEKADSIAGYNVERAAVIEFATARATSAATLAKEAAAAYTRIENLIREFETKYPDGNIQDACTAYHFAWKEQEQATYYAAQCADYLARWIERHPVWNAA